GRDHLRLRASPLETARRVVLALPEVEDVTPLDDTLRIAAGPGAARVIARSLVEAGVALDELYREQNSLEQVFLELTRETVEGEGEDA
ncbi:MAG TPA: hypothetical protein VFU72_15195, partial [Nitrolancea sp.]|nr:hypothetical protein [Nitrolancea sp.]